MANENQLKRVQDLVRLAQDGDGEENRTAAVKAMAMMKELQLVLVPKSEIERVERVLKEVGGEQRGNDMKNMLIGALAGAILGPSVLGKKGVL
jgi:nicotinamide mononucleotide adenylyltransferase